MLRPVKVRDLQHEPKRRPQLQRIDESYYRRSLREMLAFPDVIKRQYSRQADQRHVLRHARCGLPRANRIAPLDAEADVASTQSSSL